MTLDDIIAFTAGLDGVLTLRPAPGDGSPEIAWGDVFFYYAPDGILPKGQPFATVVTKDYPGDTASRLDRPGAFRVNAAAGRDAADHPAEGPDDTVLAHPVHGGWLAVTNPGPRTSDAVRELLRAAHDRARSCHERRA